MVKILIEQFKIACRVLVVITVLTGLLYPTIVTLIAQGFFTWHANGSMITSHGKTVGSFLIGQNFTDAKYFWGRPSATARFPYDAENSSGSNLALSNPQFITTVKARIDTLRQADQQQHALIPADLVTTSASGLDPDISPAAAFYQVPRIARTRNISEETVNDLVKQFVHHRTLFILGEPRVNVLKLNLALDHLVELQQVSR